MAPNTALESGAGAGLVSAAAQCEPLGSPTALVEKTSVSRHSTRRMGSFSREVAGDRSLAIEYSVQREGAHGSLAISIRCKWRDSGPASSGLLGSGGHFQRVARRVVEKDYGLTLDGLGMVGSLWRPLTNRARALLASAEGGKFRLDDDAQVGPS